jgi:hypothetical protein
MSYGKKLIDQNRDELLATCMRLVEVIKQKSRDLPPNKAANQRHQRHKLAWGKAKSRMVRLLNAALPHVPDDLAADIHYELDHQEMLWHKTRTRGKRNTSKNRRKVRRGYLNPEDLAERRP